MGAGRSGKAFSDRPLATDCSLGVMVDRVLVMASVKWSTGPNKIDSDEQDILEENMAVYLN